MMPFMAWEDRFSVGHAEVDKQHRNLFELVNNVHDMIKMGVTPELDRILDELDNYTREHFQYEESVMRVSGYSDLMAHKQKHTDLLNQVQFFRKQLHNGERVSLVNVTKFLAQWLTTHILIEDMAWGKTQK